MPELPEVQTTVDGINTYAAGRTIISVWTDYHSDFYVDKENIKDPKYFKKFKKEVVGNKIISARRRAKHILIALSENKTILVHMKMTGHFLYGDFIFNKKEKRWEPPEGYWNKTWKKSKTETKKELPFSDPFNDFIHLVFELDNGKILALSDMRKFASVCLINKEGVERLDSGYGPEPLEKGMHFEKFFERLRKRPNMKVKSALLDQSLVAGFGNIYTDEVLWEVGVHPESSVGAIPEEKWEEIFTEGKRILRKALRYGGDSMGDYRTIEGRSGRFQNMHNAYKRDGEECSRCVGVIEKKQVGARIARFCTHHQIFYK